MARSGEEVETLRTYIGPYQQLEQLGIVGEEQRLNWIDALRVANIDAQLYGVDYEVGSQMPYSFAAEVNAAGLPVQQSMMKVKLGLLYETDLLTFFRVLARAERGCIRGQPVQPAAPDLGRVQADQPAHPARGVRRGMGHHPAALLRRREVRDAALARAWSC